MQPATPSSGMSEPARLAGVIVSPGAAFDDIAKRPTWFVPLLLITLTSLLFMWFFTRRVGWERFIQATVASNPQIEQMPAEQRERVLEQQRKFIPIMGWVGPVVGTPVIALVVAAVLLGVFNLAMGAQFRFISLLAIVSYSWLPGAIHSLIALGIMHLKDPDEFDLTRPTAFNVGAFLDPDSSSKWLQSLLGSFDLFTFWTIALLAIGVQALDRKRSFGSCLTGVLAPWLLWICGKTAWAAIFS